MLKRHTNFNTVGKISCLGLLALTFFLVSPIAATPDKAHAVDADQDSKLSVGETPSTVNLSFAPASGSGSVTPNASTGAKAQTNVIANIDVSNSSGYSVYLGSNSSNLVGKDNKHTVPGVSGPLKTTLTDISTMQEMTSKICQDSVLNETKQLKDTRDGKLYWVAKLPDEQCWMTQNLDLDLGTS